MRCFYCNKHEAVKSYERVKYGKSKREYYCLSCYEKIVLEGQATESELSPVACPYCDRTVKEFETSKLVGCPYCYKTLKSGVLPTVARMQGEGAAHAGKTPAVSEKSEILLETEGYLSEEYKDSFRAQLAKEDRFQKQVGELQLLVDYLKTRDPEREREYREKLERMQRTGEVEEEIIW